MPYRWVLAASAFVFLVTGCSRVPWGPRARKHRREMRAQGVTPTALPGVRVYLDSIETGYIGRYRMRHRHRHRQWLSFKTALGAHGDFEDIVIIRQRDRWKSKKSYAHYARFARKYPPQNSVRLSLEFWPKKKRVPGPVVARLSVYDSHNRLVAHIEEQARPLRTRVGELLPALARRLTARPEALRAAARGQTAIARALFDPGALVPQVFSARAPPVPAPLLDAGEDTSPPVARSDGREDLRYAPPAPTLEPTRDPGPLPPPRRRNAFRIIRERPEVARPVWKTLLKALGGLEVAGTLGIAQVSSSIRDENGTSIKVASGRAEQRGFRIALHSAPDTAGFFVSPALGYLFQDITIRDFQFELPQIAGTPGQNIGAACSRPTTGASIPCDLATAYALRMQSTYAGVSAGADLVAGNSRVEYFAQAIVSLYALEWRSLRTTIGNNTRRDKGVTGFRSGAAGLSTGFRFPKAHLALKLTADYEVFSRFEYGDSVEFRGPLELDEQAQIYRRRRVFAESAKLGVFHGQLAMAILF